MVGTHLYHLSKPMGYTTPRISPNINYGLWGIKTHQCRVINFNKRTALLIQSVGCWWWGRLQEGRGYVGNLYSLITFAVNLQLL